MHKTKCTGADLINKIVSIMEEEIGERGGKKKSVGRRGES